MSGLPMPPHARRLCEARAANLPINLIVHVGDAAFRRASHRRTPAVLACPPESEPTDFDWSVVAGLAATVVCWNRPQAWVDSFGRELVLAGAEKVCLLDCKVDRHERVAKVATIWYAPRGLA